MDVFLLLFKVVIEHVIINYIISCFIYPNDSFLFTIFHFFADDYRSHTSCISEAERYEKTVYKGPKKGDTSKRKLTPQELWISILTESLDNNCPPDLTSYIQQIISYENVPRKEKAFRNFASNSLKLYGRQGDTIIASLWKHFCATRQKRTEEKEAKEKAAAKAKSAEEEKKKESSSAEKTDSESENETKNVDKSSSRSTSISEPTPSKAHKKIVSKAIKKALKKAPKHELKLKELRKMIKGEVALKKSIKGKDEWKKIIKESILKSKKSMKLEGKKVILIDKN
jgi:cell growth-regulating nucleolar protein